MVKGTEPLYQTKCQMEKTDFVKLLCRKKNPYDPRKQRIKRERKYKNNDPVMLSGKKQGKRQRGCWMPGKKSDILR